MVYYVVDDSFVYVEIHNFSFVDFFAKNIGLSLHGELMGYEDLKDEVTKIEKKGIFFKLSDYKNYK